MERLSVLLDNAEPSRSIEGVRWLVDSCSNLPANNSANVFVDARKYGNVLLDPGSMRYGRDVDRREEFWFKGTALYIFPSKGVVVKANKVMKEFPLLWK